MKLKILIIQLAMIVNKQKQERTFEGAPLQTHSSKLTR